MKESTPSKTKVLLSGLFIITGATMLVYGYGYNKIDWVIVFTFFYTTLSFLVVEKKLKIPPLVELYKKELFDKLSILLFIPSSFLLYKIGYKYNIALTFQNTFALFLSSALLGIGLGLALIIVSLPYEVSEG